MKMTNEAKRRSKIAKAAWATRRANEAAERKRRSKIAKKAWATRRANGTA